MLAGGGTGGHLFPALAIARGLRAVDHDCDIRFVGSRYGLEARVLSEENEVFYPLNIRGIQRGLGPVSLGRNLIFPWRFAVSRRRCRQIMNEFEPHVVVGTGGYASGVPLLAAQRRRIPTLVHEQNAYPGMTTRRLARKANVVCLTYQSSAQYLHAGKCVLTGNPVRFDLDNLPSQRAARKQLGLPIRRQVVFILGGSQGSRPLNNHFLAHRHTYTDKMKAHLFWQTGSANYERLSKAIGSNGRVTLVPFITDMAAAFVAADLVVSRAGAMTIAELTCLGRPSILVPLPTAAADHQTLNAQVLVKKKAACLVPQSELSRGMLEEQVRRLIKYPGRLGAMGKRAQKLARPDAAETIVKHILKLAEE